MTDTRHERLTRLRSTTPAAAALVLFACLIATFATPQICGAQSLRACAQNVGQETAATGSSSKAPTTTQPASVPGQTPETLPITTREPLEAPSAIADRDADADANVDLEPSFDLLHDHPSAPVVIGVTTPQTPGDLTEIDTFEAATGADVGIASWYVSFTKEFDRTQAERVVERGELPMITWEPWDPEHGVQQPDYALAKIAAGDHDAYLRRWARALARFDKPVLLRFAHEMNGNWYPWGVNVNGNTTRDYVAAWRHVHAIVEEVGADKVLWVWSPNTVRLNSHRLDELYPGDAYVDWLAIDGYNGGTDLNMGGWQTPKELFIEAIAVASTISDRPIMIGETASSEEGGDKAEWLEEFFTLVRSNPDIQAFIWFDLLKETDWRVHSSPQTLAAFRRGVASL